MLTPALGDSGHTKKTLRRVTSCRLLRSYIGSGDPLVARRTGGHDDEGMATNIAARLRRHGGGRSSAAGPHAGTHPAREERRPPQQKARHRKPGGRGRRAPEEPSPPRGGAEHDAPRLTNGPWAR